MINDELYKKTVKLRDEIAGLQHRKELYENKKDDYFEPHMMEYLDQYDGYYNDETDAFTLKFKVMGTQYEGRIDEIEFLRKNESVLIKRDPANQFNKNNFAVLNADKKSIGNMPWKLCDALAPLYDNNNLLINHAKISYIEPLSKRNRHAMKPIVFIELAGSIIETYK